MSWYQKNLSFLCFDRVNKKRSCSTKRPQNDWSLIFNMYIVQKTKINWIFGLWNCFNKLGFRIRIHLIRIRIQHFRLNTDPDLEFWWPKIYLSLGLHKVRSSCRRSLQLSKENIQHFKHEISNFFYFWGSFWIRIRIPNTDSDPDPLTWLKPCIKLILFLPCWPGIWRWE